jgi:tetratricopeptide (TPR) repeat protein
VPLWQRQEVQEVLREIDDFGTTLRRRKWKGRLMQGAGQITTLDKHSFRECLEKDEYLAGLRTEYAHKSAEERRMAADWEYHSAIAGSMFNDALARLGRADVGAPSWPDGVLALAIDPLFAPAILTVGSIEHQLGRHDEAMELFLTLTTLPPDEPDLSIIIDKAGQFLLDAEDYERARALYAAAEKAFPNVAIYPAGLSYCLGRLQLREEAIAKARRAVELDPLSHMLLNDLGWTLYQAGHLEEAEATLAKSVNLAPLDYELARNNLEEVRAVLAGKRAREESEM